MLFVKMKNERKAVNASVQVTNVQKNNNYGELSSNDVHTQEFTSTIHFISYENIFPLFVTMAA